MSASSCSALAIDAAVSLLRDSIDAFESLAASSESPRPMEALLQWLGSPVSEAESEALGELAYQRWSKNQTHFSAYRLRGAATLDDRALSLLAAAPRDGSLHRRLGALEAAGWSPKLKGLAILKGICSEAHDSQALLWLAERGWLSLQTPALPASGESERTAICQAFAKETELDLAILERLAGMGVFADADGCVGFTDFVSFGLMRSARKLGELGFKPRPATLSGGRGEVGSSPVAVYARVVTGRREDASRPMEEQIAQINHDLADLAERGASFLPTGPSPEEARLSDPYVASARSRFFSREQKPLIRALYHGLKRHGADPNASGLYLFEEVRRVDWQGGDSDFFDLAIELGADPKSRPELLLSAPAGWTGSRLAGLSWMDKLIALGADPAAIPNVCPEQEHPIAWAARYKNFLYANGSLHRGVSPEWIDEKTGATCFHTLAQMNGAEALKLFQRLAADPRSKRLVDQKTSIKEGKGGDTALMLACAKLNIEQVKTLLDAGADPNAQNASGWTPLHHAGRRYGAQAQNKCAPVVSLLLEAGADPSIINASGLTAGQAMAKKAPLAGLQALLSVRPEDVTGSEDAARQAAQALGKRGAKAVSVVERAILESDGAPSAPVKKKSARL